MSYNQATLCAALGKILMLPGWRGYFMWDYTNKELVFRNGDYFLNNKELRDKGVMDRNDWFYIV